MTKGREMLERIRILEHSVKIRKQDVESYETLLTRCTAPVKDVIVQGSTPNDGAVWDGLIAAKAAYESALNEYVCLRQQIVDIIDGMDDPFLAQLLWDKYLGDDDPTSTELAKRYSYSKSGINGALERAERYFSKLSSKWSKVDESVRK